MNYVKLAVYLTSIKILIHLIRGRMSAEQKREMLQRLAEIQRLINGGNRL